MPKISCDVCLPNINQYYDDSYDIVANNQKLISMAMGHPQGAKLLASGRVVVLRDGVRCHHGATRFSLISLQHFRSNNIAILLKGAAPQAEGTEKIKMYWVLALVDPDTKSGQQGKAVHPVLHPNALIMFVDIESQAIPPHWPPAPESLTVPESIYQLITVPFTSIAIVTSRMIKVCTMELS
jgi:antiviral helicase SKI2